MIKKDLFKKKIKKIIKGMKITVFICFTCMVSVFADELYSQEAKFSLAMEKATIRQVISQIERQSDYFFLFTDEGSAELDKIVNLSIKDKGLSEILESLFNETSLSYVIIGRQVIITKREGTDKQSEQMPVIVPTVLQGIPIAGKVFDNFGDRMPGVAVIIRGTNVGTSTDVNGEFIINVPSDSSVLQFRFIGYRTQEVVVGNERVISVIMKEEAAELGEVVVVAFGTQKKESVISSITMVRPADLKVPSSNLTTAFAGRIAGVISYQRSGEPGADDAEFFIRGVTTFGYAKSPLILLDGLEVSSADLSRLQPDDIASFSIMKDATASALYGSRGANGVILVTTKEGREGKAQVSLRYETSISQPTRKIELADPITYMRLHNEAVTTRDPMGRQPYSQEKIDMTERGGNPYVYPANDWYKMLLKDQTMNHRLNMNISGGGNVARYYIAATYNRDNGNLNVDERNNFNSNIQLNRIMLRSNMNVKITPTTEAVVRLYSTFDDYTGPIPSGTQVYNLIMRANPVLFPAYFPANEASKSIDHIMFGNYDGTGSYINPYAYMVFGYKNYTTSTVIGQFEASQKLDFLLKGLKIRGLYSSTRYAHFDVFRNYSPFYYTVGRYDRQENIYFLTNLNPEGGREYLSYSEGTKTINANTYIEAAIDYSQTFNEAHDVGALLVWYQREQIKANAGSLQLSLPFRNTGLSGRVTYGYKSKYFVEGVFGYNGSERFAKENRFGFFPSIGLGWVVSNENFYPEALAKIIPNFKLKATHGLVGNDAIGRDADRFFYLSEVDLNNGSRTFLTGQEFLITRNGVTISRYENPLITWETAVKTNLGLELNLLSWMNISLDVYQEHRSNILLTRSNVPATMGLEAIPQTNFGKAEGQGLDFSVDANTNISTDWWISGRVNFTYAKSKFVQYDEPDYSQTPWKTRVGQSLNQNFGFIAERLFIDENDVKNSPSQYSDTRGGDIKFKDINYDYVIDEYDQVPIGFPTVPEIVYGFGFSTGYKGFDLSCFFQGMARESFWIDVRRTGPFTNYVHNDDYGINQITQRALLKAYADDYWSETNRNPHALWPRLSNQINNNNIQTSTWFMRDGSFLRLKSLEFGYSIPEKLIQRIKLVKVRVYFAGTNLLTFSRFNLWDPEMAGNGLGYPVQKVYNFGVQASF